jgi:UDP-N-acetylmuramyl pentapeptide phosphotransferase/UDP-N-acetylglucosamine-1-phosphate transferase
MIWIIPVSLIVAVLSYILTGVTLKFLRRRAILDHPNERSSHAVPIPRGGGIPIIAITTPLWLIPIDGNEFGSIEILLVGAIILAAISWLDDIKPRSPALRLAVQVIAVALGIYSFPADASLFGNILPQWIEVCTIGLAWLWFINLFNFMDGIDAISSAQTIGICLGLIVIGLILKASPVPIWYPASLCAAFIGFAFWNLPPAKIFLGDIGSITVGFLLGWLLLQLAYSGYIVSAIILPLYYLADATATLLIRGARGEKIWQAHREHFYQKAVQLGKSHLNVSAMILGTNIVLAGLAIFAIIYPITCLTLAFLIVALLIHRLMK